MNQHSKLARCAAVIVLLSLAGRAAAQHQIFDSAGQSPEEEIAKLTAVLKSDAPRFDKMLACKRLAIIGDERAVPTLAKLLADKELSHSARYALETIPGPAADEALVAALPTAGGHLAGVINSIGVRRNSAAVPALAPYLTCPSTEVAAAAAAALAEIASEDTPDLLLEAIKNSPPGGQLESAFKDSALRCAERLAAQQKTDAAKKLYEALAVDSSPRPIRLAASLGLLRITPERELPLRLTTALKSSDDVQQEAAVTASYELGGGEVTNVLAAALAGASELQQIRLLDALSRRIRGDATATEQVTNVAKNGSPAMRVAALTCLGRVGDHTTVPFLMTTAVDQDPQIAAAAVASLDALRGSAGNKIDETVLQQLESSDDVQRRVVIAVLGRRGVKQAAPALFKLLDSSDEATRLLVLQALSQTVDEEGFAKLVDRIPAAKSDAERQAAIAAVSAACRRIPDADAVVSVVVERMKTWPAAERPLLLGILGAVGGESALKIVAASADSGTPELADAATRALGEWMTPDAAPVLYKIAASDSKYKVRALRGYLRIARQLNLQPQERLKMCQEALKIAERPDERQLVLGVLTRCPSPAAIDMAGTLLDDAAIRPQAAETIVIIAERIKDQDPAAASSAAQQALAAGLADGFSQRAQALVKTN